MANTFAGREATDSARFHVSLPLFDGPFDLLLNLIAKHKLDITEVALAQVTDEFIEYINRNENWNIDEASQFLIVAATLLDIKTATLLPGAEIDENNLELLEARDLLFARLLQYRAFKEVAKEVGQKITEQSLCLPRSTSLEEAFSGLLPELKWVLGTAEFAAVAALALQPKSIPTINFEHLHTPAVSVTAETAGIISKMDKHKVMTFRQLTADAKNSLVIVARFLALLELFRSGLVNFEQAEVMGELTVRRLNKDDYGEIRESDFD